MAQSAWQTLSTPLLPSWRTVDGKQVQGRALGGCGNGHTWDPEESFKVFQQLVSHHLLCPFLNRPRVFYTQYYLPSPDVQVMYRSFSYSIPKAHFRVGVTAAHPMLRTINKPMMAFQFQRLNIDLSKANLLSSEYFYMNVLSADLPGVKCKLYSLSIFSFASKGKMAIVCYLRVVRTHRIQIGQAVRAAPESAQVGPKYPGETGSLNITYRLPPTSSS